MGQQLSAQDQAIADFTTGFTSDMNQRTMQKYIKQQELRDRFTAVVVRAVQENPDLLKADRKSLYYACQRAAQDGLIPDGREGFLGIYNTNVGTQQDPKWIQKVQWQPMIYGLRKMLGKHGYHLDAELVYENEIYEFHKGDNPRIVHQAAKLGTERGKLVGAYAIATDLKSGAKHHEEMNMDELEQVRAASRNPNGTVWKNWPGEMHRKAPAKRLFKRLPLPDEFLGIIDRDNEQFDLDRNLSQPTAVATDVQAAVRQIENNGNDAKLPPDMATKAEPIEATAERVSEPETQEEGFVGQEPDF